MGSKCRHIYPYKTEVEGDLKQTHREGDTEMEMKTESGVMPPQATERSRPPEDGRGKEQSLP